MNVYYFKLLSFGKGQVSIIHEQKCKYPKQNISELDLEMLKERKEIMMKSDVFQIGKAESTLESILGKFTMLTAWSRQITGLPQYFQKKHLIKFNLW